VQSVSHRTNCTEISTEIQSASEAIIQSAAR
jgi:hypothetical protein